MDRATAEKIIREYAPELCIKPNNGQAHIDVARSKDTLQVHSIMIPQERVGTVDVNSKQQREALIQGLDDARRILPQR